MVIVLGVNIYSVQNGSKILVWYKCNCDKYVKPMKYRYSYNIKDQSGKEEVINCQSYKKLLKQLNSKYKEGEVISIKYFNKKDHELLKYVKIKRVE